MRDPVTVTFGGRDYSLLPEYGVMPSFEGRHGGLLDHLQQLYDGRASIQRRAYLLLLGLQAGDPSQNWTQEAVQKAIFEAGAWSNEMVSREAEFINALLYTPEQLREKKRQEAEMQAELTAALAASSEEPFSSQPSS